MHQRSQVTRVSYKNTFYRGSGFGSLSTSTNPTRSDVTEAKKRMLQGEELAFIKSHFLDWFAWLQPSMVELLLQCIKHLGLPFEVKYRALALTSRFAHAVRANYCSTGYNVKCIMVACIKLAMKYECSYISSKPISKMLLGIPGSQLVATEALVLEQLGWDVTLAHAVPFQLHCACMLCYSRCFGRSDAQMHGVLHMCDLMLDVLLVSPIADRLPTILAAIGLTAPSGRVTRSDWRWAASVVDRPVIYMHEAVAKVTKDTSGQARPSIW